MNSNKKFRRTKSHVLMSDVIKLEHEHKVNSPDKPVHDNVESYFSTSSGFTNFRGLLNLMIILLVVSNCRVALENVLKYGILIKPFLIAELIFNDPYHWPCITLLLISNVFIITIYIVEILLEKGFLNELSGILVQILTLSSSLVYSSYVVLVNHPNPIFSCPLLAVYSVIFLKLWSYCHVNKWCREERHKKIAQSINYNKLKKLTNMKGLDLASTKRSTFHIEGSGDKVFNDYVGSYHRTSSISETSNCSSDSVTFNPYQQYPDNLTLYDLYYFMVAPTLCYELNFPRTLKIRKRFLLKRLLELIFLPQMMFGLVQQWILPLLRNSVTPFSQSDFLVIIERLLKLSIPNHLIWLMGFYVIFHSALNVLGELLFFGDRLFYKDWWNASTVTEFWSTWNIPVHRWASRHIFKPLLARNYSKMWASVIVFAISAFFHEFMVSVPLHMFRLWSFYGMIGQVPFAVIVSIIVKNVENGSESTERTQIGNFLVWISLIIGQPLAMMMYFHDYYVENLH